MAYFETNWDIATKTIGRFANSIVIYSAAAIIINSDSVFKTETNDFTPKDNLFESSWPSSKKTPYKTFLIQKTEK